MSVDAFLEDADETAASPRALAEAALAAAVELLQGELAQSLFAEPEALVLLQQLAGACQDILAEIGAERQGLEAAGFEASPEWERRLANARLVVPLALLHVQLQLAAAGIEVPARLLGASEILTLGITEDLDLLMQQGNRVSEVLDRARREELHRKWGCLVWELAHRAAADHLERCGRNELVAIQTFASFRKVVWCRADEELAGLARSCAREARTARRVAALERNVALLRHGAAAAARLATQGPWRLLRLLAAGLRALSPRLRVQQDQA